MKNWLTAFLMLALGVAVIVVSGYFFEYSLWLVVPGVALVLLGLMPLDAAKAHMLAQDRAQGASDSSGRKKQPNSQSGDRGRHHAP